MVKKSFFIIGVFLTATVSLHAQSWGTNPMLNQLAADYVKSLDEFIHRFNADELHPSIADPNSPDVRKMSLVTLFDWQRFSNTDTAKARQVMDFCEKVQRGGYRLEMSTEGLYAEAQCLFTKGKSEYDVSVILRYEEVMKGYYRWAIVGAHGLDVEKLLDTTRTGYINPVQHELHFGDLNRAFPHAERFMSRDRHVDQLSFLLGMTTSGVLKFEGCQHVRYHVVAIPGYIFTVGLQARNDVNSGWLIENLYSVDHQQKIDYVSHLLGE